MALMQSHEGEVDVSTSKPFSPGSRMQSTGCEMLKTKATQIEKLADTKIRSLCNRGCSASPSDYL